MNKRTIVYVSTNEIWGGSEVLWTRSAKQILEKGHRVSIVNRYTHSEISNLITSKDQYLNTHSPKSFLKRVTGFLLRVSGIGKTLNGPVYQFIKKENPDLVIISQGTNIGSKEVMMNCMKLKIPFITITQLVTEFLWIFINDKEIFDLKNCYKAARCNFFVAKSMVQFNDFMLGERLVNTEVVYNPFNAVLNYKNQFPVSDNYNVAIVGRVECMHKGIDLLIKIIALEKWKRRNIIFTFYGNGPHMGWLTDAIGANHLNNVKIAGHVNDIKDIWDNNQILLMASRMEGQSIALIEAMYCSRPAIVTNVGGVSELISDGINGFIAKNATVEDIDDAMERAWTHRERWMEMGKNASHTIQTIYPADPVAFFNDKIVTLLSDL